MSIAGDAKKATPEPGDPAAWLARYHELLEAWDAARKAHHAAQVDGDADAVHETGWGLAVAVGKLTGFKEDTACALAISLRWLNELYPLAAGPLQDLLGGQEDQANRLANLEAAVAAEVPV